MDHITNNQIKLRNNPSTPGGSFIPLCSQSPFPKSNPYSSIYHQKRVFPWTIFFTLSISRISLIWKIVFNNLYICSWHHPYGRKWRGNKKPLDEGERGEWKSWLKTQQSENEVGNIWGNSGNSVRLNFLGSKITADGDCSHEIKRHLLLGRKVMTNLDRIFKSRDITLPTKVRLAKAMVFPLVMYGCERWTVKKAECWRIDAFKLWVGEDSWESLGLQGDTNSKFWI